MTKFCHWCQTDLDTDKFGKDKTRSDGLSNYCRECKASYSREFYRRNRRKVLAQHRAYNRRNRFELSKKRHAKYQQKKQEQAND